MESQLQGWMESYKRQGRKTRSVWLIQLPCTFFSLEHLPPGGQGTPEQLQDLRFAEAKARKMPWDDDRTM
eukprot:4119641-Amphidinium_carterae.1